MKVYQHTEHARQCVREMKETPRGYIKSPTINYKHTFYTDKRGEKTSRYVSMSVWSWVYVRLVRVCESGKTDRRGGHMGMRVVRAAVQYG